MHSNIVNRSATPASTDLPEQVSTLSQEATASLEKTHDYFLSTDKPVEYTCNHTHDNTQTSTTTTITHLEGNGCDVNDTVDVFESRQAMRQHVLDMRKDTPSNERGRIKPKLKHANCSDVTRQDFKYEITTTGLSQDKTRSFTTKYDHNSPFNGLRYNDEKGNVRLVTGAVIASQDRSALELTVPRVVIDNINNASVFYSGRPDSEKKAIAQAQQIANTEFSLANYEISKMKGIKNIGTPDAPKYQFSYAVFSITKPGLIQSPTGYNERDGLKWEKEALAKITGETIHINGVEVELNPIHIHSNINMIDEYRHMMGGALSGQTLANSINTVGYTKLLTLISDDQKKTAPIFIQNALIQIQDPKLRDKLTSEQQYMLTDLVARHFNLPVVGHCKSCVDRTSIAAVIMHLNHEIITGKLEITDENQPQNIMQTREYRELALAYLNAQHQVSRAVHFGEDSNGEYKGLKALRLQLGSIPAAANILPEEATKNHSFWAKRSVVLTVTPIAMFVQFLLAIPLAPLYQAIASIISLALLIFTHFKYDNARNVCSVLKAIHLAPYQMKSWNIPKVGYRRKIDANSELMNGQGRHISKGGKELLPADYKHVAGPQHPMVGKSSAN